MRPLFVLIPESWGCEYYNDKSLQHHIARIPGRGNFCSGQMLLSSAELLILEPL